MFPIVIVKWEGGREGGRAAHRFIRSNYYHIDLPLCEQINFKLNKLGLETIKLAMINFPQRWAIKMDSGWKLITSFCRSTLQNFHQNFQL